jgi:hypothetical protein
MTVEQMLQNPGCPYRPASSPVILPTKPVEHAAARRQGTGGHKQGIDTQLQEFLAWKLFRVCRLDFEFQEY